MKGFLKKLIGTKPRETVFVVSGLPRSGTSMMMKMLEVGGIPPLTDKVRTADDDNPKGYYEFERVKQLDKGDTGWLADAQGKAVKVISALLKHLPDDYDYRIVFMRREMAEILASQKKMLINRGEDPEKVDDEELSSLFNAHLQHVLSWLGSHANVQVLYVNYNEILSDPQPQVEKVSAFLGGNLDIERMVGVVDPALYRNRQVT